MEPDGADLSPPLPSTSSPSTLQKCQTRGRSGPWSPGGHGLSWVARTEVDTIG